MEFDRNVAERIDGIWTMSTGCSEMGNVLVNDWNFVRTQLNRSPNTSCIVTPCSMELELVDCDCVGRGRNAVAWPWLTLSLIVDSC